MTTLHIMRGVPGSGKSTIADKMLADATEPTIIVGRDDLREFYFRDEGMLGKEKEDFITKAEFSAIRHALKAGINVISDNTHIKASYVNDKVKVAYEFDDVEVNIVEVNTSLELSLERNRVRKVMGGRYVPPEVIEKMYKAYKPFKYTPMPKFAKYVPDTTKPKCLLVDVDGTIAHNDGHRSYYEWNKVGGDKPIQNVIDLVNAVGRYEREVKVIIFSGRDGVSEQDTLDWLDKHEVLYDDFFMRAANDMRPDTIVKMEMFDLFIRDHYNCIGVVDDRPAVVRQWMKHGITVFHVDPFGEDF